MSERLLTLARLLAGLLVCIPAWAQPLPALRAEPRQVTASGVSSGAYMAVQLHLAHSSLVSGVAAIAGGPYYCAQGSVWTALHNCMTPGWATPVPQQAVLKLEAETAAQARRIDPVANLASARVWLFSGSNDRTVDPRVVQALRDFYVGFGARVVLVADKAAGHAMVTESYGAACGLTEPPFINDCDYDAAGELLKHLLGALKPPGAPAGAHLRKFDQKPYTGGDAAALSLDDSGFVYVPKECEDARCRVHVAFHGCRQGHSEAGSAFVERAGYNRWAETNRLIVLYPQTIARHNPTTYNPRGCWDWWGYTGAQYATKDGAQIRAVKAMLERLSSGSGP